VKHLVHSGKVGSFPLPASLASHFSVHPQWDGLASSHQPLNTDSLLPVPATTSLLSPLSSWLEKKG
jgi:hypothetical protein